MIPLLADNFKDKVKQAMEKGKVRFRSPLTRLLLSPVLSRDVEMQDLGNLTLCKSWEA